MVWALATLRTTNNKLIEVLTQRAMVPAVLNQFNSQHVTNIAWAMAKLGIVPRPPPFMVCVCLCVGVGVQA